MDRELPYRGLGRKHLIFEMERGVLHPLHMLAGVFLFHLCDLAWALPAQENVTPLEFVIFGMLSY